jgi:hypothetical protein
VSWEKGKYSRNASQELSVPWAETTQGRWFQNPVFVLTGTSSGESFGISSQFLTSFLLICGVGVKMGLVEKGMTQR